MWNSTLVVSFGLYYKQVPIINDNSSIIYKLSFKLIDDARVIIYDRNRFIIQATGVTLKYYSWVEMTDIDKHR